MAGELSRTMNADSAQGYSCPRDAGVGKPAEKHPWWQVPAWVPIFPAGVTENWCDAGSWESWLGGVLLIAM